MPQGEVVAEVGHRLGVRGVLGACAVHVGPLLDVHQQLLKGLDRGQFGALVGRASETRWSS
jgi:hypothetical protein